LKEELKKRGLKVSGVKDELISRLEESENAPEPQTELATPSVVMKGKQSASTIAKKQTTDTASKKTKAASTSSAERETEIRKELTVRQRKLRQIFDLEEQYRLDPASLNPDQVDKIQRKGELLGIISNLENERRQIAAGKRNPGGAAPVVQSTNKNVKEAPPPPKKLSAFLVWARVCSSDLAISLVTLGKVRVNGQVTDDPELRIDPEEDEVVVSGEVIRAERAMDLWEDKEEDRRERRRRNVSATSRGGFRFRGGPSNRSNGGPGRRFAGEEQPPTEKELMRMYLKYNGGVPAKPPRKGAATAGGGRGRKTY